MRRSRLWLLALVGLACRQPNPQWRGPADGGDDIVDPTTGGDVGGEGQPGDPCGIDDDCADPLLCGPEGCQQGNAGEPCNSRSDCNASAPGCGPDGCQAGIEGDACTSNDACGPMASRCGPEGCQDGSSGDPCTKNQHCMGMCKDGTCT